LSQALKQYGGFNSVAIPPSRKVMLIKNQRSATEQTLQTPRQNKSQELAGYGPLAGVEQSQAD